MRASSSFITLPYYAAVGAGFLFALFESGHLHAQAVQPTPPEVIMKADVARQPENSGPTGGGTADFRDRLGLLDVQILGEPQALSPWTLAAAANGYHTTNAELTGLRSVHDNYLAATALLAYQPKITDDLSGLFAVRQDIFRYDKLKDLDFTYLEATAGVGYQVLPSTVASLRYVYTRLDEGAYGGDFFDDHGIAAGLETTWRYSQTFRFVVGGGAQVSLQADPSAGRRDDYGLHAALICEPVEHLQFIAGYEGSFYDYGFAGREDFNHVFRVGVIVRPASWLWLGACIGYTTNHSNLNAFDYSAWTTGVGLGVDFHF